MNGHEAGEESPAPKFLENTVLVALGLLANVVLMYQLPRWANDLDPTFVAPRLLERSGFPAFFHLVAIPPIFWIALVVLTFVRICRNYGWRLRW
jgi:hypothetical protein